MSIRKFAFLALVAVGALTGCAKNVDRINFTKWGHSYVLPEGQSSNVDTTAQGGSNTLTGNVVPQNGINAVPKASVGGAYHRSMAASPSYRMVGGFHTGNR